MNVLIVCHAGVGLGLGHLMRSLVVARALQHELDANVTFLIQGDPVQHADLAGFSHQFLGADKNLSEAILKQAQYIDARVVVLDLHPNLIPANVDIFLKAIRLDGRKIIGVDSLAGHRDNLDLVFVPSFRFSPSDDLTGSAPILFGWDCFLLNVKYPANEWKSGRRVLALAGGSDATGLGATWPTLLNEALPDNTELDWVTGPYAQQPVLPAFQKILILNHQSPSGLDNLMMAANYAVTVYGVSFFELLYYGVPTVVFSPYGNKDDAELAEIAAEGVALVAKDEVEAVAKLKELMSDEKLAATLSQQARQRLSILGGHKIAQAITALVA
ncbi:MAG: hypothetical protein PSU93_11735 [Methylobacter sp.]|uniref:Glycosyl transferase family 28 C-terminal domain-containing protein n=1 Tax=Candidatus Methylobacter titanis TaxID=3053457 RepID=A0AA43Q6U0_9GAMM|nr:hypothetical protein [Candidatus Methylobacter titanis]